MSALPGLVQAISLCDRLYIGVKHSASLYQQSTLDQADKEQSKNYTQLYIQEVQQQRGNIARKMACKHKYQAFGFGLGFDKGRGLDMNC